MWNIWIALGGPLLVLLAVGVYWLASRRTPSGPAHFRAEPLISPAQMEMFSYLRSTFPDKVVLHNVYYDDMLSVRTAPDLKAARRMLADRRVDFVVCDESSGHPVFAFEVEKYRVSDTERHEQEMRLRNRILKSAGVRLVYLKNSVTRMPAPDELRAKLNLKARPRPQLERVPSAREKLDSQFSQFDSQHASTSFADSEVLSLSQLGSLDDLPAPRRRGSGW